MKNKDIVEVIKHHVKLEQAGPNYKGCCPFHGEKTASLVVNPSSQMFHCFGCGIGGNSDDFEKMLAHKLNLEQE